MGIGDAVAAPAALQLQPIHPKRWGRAATLLHEGEIADPGLVVAAGGGGTGCGAERAAEEVVAAAGEARIARGECVHRIRRASARGKLQRLLDRPGEAGLAGGGVGVDAVDVEAVDRAAGAEDRASLQAGHTFLPQHLVQRGKTTVP